MNDESFIASTGWLIVLRNVMAYVSQPLRRNWDNAAVAEYLSKFVDIIAAGNYSLQKIYNAAETTLNFKAWPSKSYTTKEENAPSFKSKQKKINGFSLY